MDGGVASASFIGSLELHWRVRNRSRRRRWESGARWLRRGIGEIRTAESLGLHVIPSGARDPYRRVDGWADTIAATVAVGGTVNAPTRCRSSLAIKLVAIARSVARSLQICGEDSGQFL
jgi:hypothetical protein